MELKNNPNQAESNGFDTFGFSEGINHGLEAMNFKKPSPIQAAAIPPIMDGYDVIACAQTGTGKTAAYLLPVLSLLNTYAHDQNHVNVVIMAPTRELAQQIDQQIEAFSYFVNTSTIPIYGGTGGIEYEQQRRALKLGADIIVATPGRLRSHISLKNVNLSHVDYFILDEADRMLDMGFYDDILFIRKYISDSAQCIMFSATMPPKIREMAKAIMYDPIEVNIAISRPPESISQSVAFCKEKGREALLYEILNEKMPKRAIVFFASKIKVKEVFANLIRNGKKVAQMHSDLEQNERDKVMTAFKNGETEILVATDILSRGIDVDHIELVVNFDVPNDPEDYVHRIGRTARGENLDHATAITLVSEKDIQKFNEIERFLRYKIKRNHLSDSQLEQYRPNSKMPKRAKKTYHKNKKRPQ